MNYHLSEKLPEEVRKLITGYFELDIAGKKVRTPYYRNVKRVRAELRSLIGKGTPQELVDEALVYAKLYGINLRELDARGIRQFMMKQGLGIDCSGLVAHVYDVWLRNTKRQGLYKNIRFPDDRSLYQKITAWLRPIEHIGANLLSGELNAYPVEVKDVEVGDMIRLKGMQRGHHLAIVVDVERDPQLMPTAFYYLQSSYHYGNENGVRVSKLNILDPLKELKDQRWLDRDDKDECPTYKQLMKRYGDNGLRRPNFLF